jgi:hypothetical protein
LAAVALQETVAVPEPPLMLFGVIAPQVSPDGTVSVRETVPVKPFNGAIVIVETTGEPALTLAGDVALIVKSGGAPNVKVAVAEWDREAVVPVIVTVNAF